MEQFWHNAQLLIAQNTLLSYIIIYVATIFLGNLMSFAALWLAYQGVFGPWGVLLIVTTTFAADVSGDLSWYCLGRGLADSRAGNWIERHFSHHEKIQGYLARHDRKLVFLSKFIYSSSFIIIFTVGWSKMEFRKFFRASLLAISSWIPFMTLVVFGLYRGFSLIRAKTFFHQFEVVFGFGLAVFIALNYMISQAVKRYLVREEV